MRSVTAGEPWPSRRETCATSCLLAISALACVCRRAWNITIGRPSDRHALRQSRERLSGDRGDPYGLLKISVSGFGFPMPSAIRSSSCRGQWARRTAAALGGNEIVRRPCFDLGRLNRRPSRVSSRDRSTRADHRHPHRHSKRAQRVGRLCADEGSPPRGRGAGETAR